MPQHSALIPHGEGDSNGEVRVIRFVGLCGQLFQDAPSTSCRRLQFSLRICTICTGFVDVRCLEHSVRTSEKYTAKSTAAFAKVHT